MPYDYLISWCFYLPGFLYLVTQVQHPDSSLSLTAHIHRSSDPFVSPWKCFWTLLPCPHCPCPSSAFVTNSQGPACHSWLLFKPNLHLLLPALSSWNDKWKKAKMCMLHSLSCLKMSYKKSSNLLCKATARPSLDSSLSTPSCLTPMHLLLPPQWPSHLFFKHPMLFLNSRSL